MKATDAYQIAIVDVRKALADAGFKDGDAMMEDEIALLDPEDVVFWEARAEIGVSRAIFVVWRIQPPIAEGAADGKTAFRLLDAYLDFVSLRRMADPRMAEALSKAEERFLEKGYTFEFVEQASLDAQSDRTVTTIRIGKTIH